MRLATCQTCDRHTQDWYVNQERGHPKRGEIECRDCHERRVQHETIELVHLDSVEQIRSSGIRLTTE